MLVGCPGRTWWRWLCHCEAGVPVCQVLTNAVTLWGQCHHQRRNWGHLAGKGQPGVETSSQLQVTALNFPFKFHMDNTGVPPPFPALLTLVPPGSEASHRRESNLHIKQGFLISPLATPPPIPFPLALSFSLFLSSSSHAPPLSLCVCLCMSISLCVYLSASLSI